MRTPTLSTKPLPFKVDRDNPRSLTAQLVDGFRQAIEFGYYKAGEPIPTLAELVKLTGVCPVVVRSAIRRLKAEGLLNPRAGIGTVVLGPKKKVWKGSVLIVTHEIPDNFYNAILIGKLSKELMWNDYLVTKTAVLLGPDGKPDYSQLELLLSLSPTLVVGFGDQMGAISKVIAKSGVAFMTFGTESFPAPKYKGNVSFDQMAGLTDFVAHCRRTGVKTIMEVSMDERNATCQKAFEKAGIEYMHWHISRVRTELDTEGPEKSNATRRVMEACEKRLAHGKKWLPDLLFFQDENGATGALTAFDHNGVKVPEDVKFVTWSPFGGLPIYWKSVTRLESDPHADGNVLAKYVLDVLKGKKLPDNAVIGSTYKIGETFLEK